MRIEPIEIKDKFDRNVIYRNAEKTDAINLINYLKITTCETPYLVREPDEAISPKAIWKTMSANATHFSTAMIL